MVHVVVGDVSRTSAVAFVPVYCAVVLFCFGRIAVVNAAAVAS